MKSDDLEQIEQMIEDTAHPSESRLHKALKNWIAIQYYNKDVSIDKIEFEKQLNFFVENKPSSTRIDVFINIDGGLAFYCQTHNNYPWLYKFIERLSFLKEHSTQQFIVFPENLEALYPMRWQQYLSELSKVNVDMLSAPFSIEIENKQEVQINMTYNALNKLVKIKNKFNSTKPLIVFIERDLERIIQYREGFPE